MDEAPWPWRKQLITTCWRRRCRLFRSSLLGYSAWQFQLEGQKLEGRPITAPRSGVCFDGDDLAGVVGALPRSTTNSYLPSYRLGG